MDVFRFSRSTRFFLAATALLALAACKDASGSDPRVPARLDVVAGDAQSGTVGAELPNALVVKVVDEDGKPVKDQLVNFRVVSGGGSVFAGSALTSKDGIAQERWTLGTVALDSQRVEARAVDPATGTGVVFAVFRATAAPAAAASLTALAPAAKVGFAGAVIADSPAVKVTDHFGNPVPGAVVTWTADAGSAVSPSTATGANGVARAAWILPPRVDTTYTATATAGALGSAQFTATAAIPPNAVLDKVSGDNQTVQVGVAPSQPLVARLRLLDGRGIQGAVVSFNGVPIKTSSNGTASFTFPATTQAGTHGIVAQATGGASASFALQVTSATATRIYVYSMPSFVLASSIPFVGSKVLINLGGFDAFNNPAIGTPITFRVDQGGGSVSPSPAVLSAPNGLATVEFILGGTPGTHRFWAYLPNKADSVAVGVPSIPGAPPVTVVLSADTITLPVGGEAEIAGSATDAFGNTINGTYLQTRWFWPSRNNSVASVSQSSFYTNRGTVHGWAPGATWVLGQVAGGADSTYVIVQ